MKTKGKFLSISTLLLLCTSIVATASAQTDSLRFNTVAVGKGAVAWGASWIPDGEELTYGELEYVSLMKGVFTLSGSSEDISWDEYDNVWWFRDAKAHGVLVAQWDDHMLNVRVTWEYTEGAGNPDDEFIVVGIDMDAPTLPELFDPWRATLNFRGTYDGQRITGRLNVFGGYGMFLIANLWIETLQKYALFIWFYQETPIPIPDGAITVPKATLIKFKVKIYD